MTDKKSPQPGSPEKPPLDDPAKPGEVQPLGGGDGDPPPPPQKPPRQPD